MPLCTKTPMTKRERGEPMRETSELPLASAASALESAVEGIVCMHPVGPSVVEGIVCMHPVGGPSPSEVEGIVCMHSVGGPLPSVVEGIVCMHRFVRPLRTSELSVGRKQRRLAGLGR